MAHLKEVSVAPASPARFQDLLGDAFEQVEGAVEAAGRVLTGRTIWHINSTPRGGGVAEMLQSLLAYASGAGVDVRWMTIEGDDEFFRVTKRIHNRLHGHEGDGGELGEGQRAAYEGPLPANAGELAKLVSPDDLVYLHDPQTAGLAERIRATGAKIVWRCHVGVDRPNDLVRSAWSFLIPYLEDVDAYVFSRRSFAWDGLDPNRFWFVPPSIDAFSPKNADLESAVVDSILSTIGVLDGPAGVAPAFLRQDGAAAQVTRRAELEQHAPVPADVPMVTQVSRWDRLKDPAGVLMSFADHVSDKSAHLVLAGPSTAGVADDPEGAETLQEVRAVRDKLPDDVRARTHLVSLPMEDVDENATMVNALQRRSSVVLQKSLAEGFGLTVAEAMWKARPVVATRVGGIQDQIVDGESGILIDDPANLAEVGAAVDGLLANPEGARAMGDAARERVRTEFLGSRHLVQYMQLIEDLLVDSPLAT